MSPKNIKGKSKGMSKNSNGYDYLFITKTLFNPTNDQLNLLAEAMAENVSQDDSETPAGYTYLGQFIDHDISLDSAFDPRDFPDKPISPLSLKNRRTPFLDLETLYGDTPTNPNEKIRAKYLKPGSNVILNLDETMKEVVEEKFLNDLPRLKNSPIANIVDHRNDENLAVAQTQVAFIKFHNTLNKVLFNEVDSIEVFEKTRLATIRHYQWIVLKDFLPHVIDTNVLEDVINNGNKFYFPTLKKKDIPLEFSVAAFRFGHSMVRDSYDWNRIVTKESLPPLDGSLFNLTLFTGEGKLGGFGRNHLPSEWLINWNLFFDINGSNTHPKFNFARKIDTQISQSLGFLNPLLIGKFKREYSLPAMDLYRTRALGVATGQEVSEKMFGKQILSEDKIAELLPEFLKPDFSKETPLWFYLLAESKTFMSGEKMGKIGSRIIAETLVGLLKLDEFSILNSEFTPSKEVVSEQGFFGMAELLRFVAKHNKSYDELNPIK